MEASDSEQEDKAASWCRRPPCPPASSPQPRTTTEGSGAETDRWDRRSRRQVAQTPAPAAGAAQPRRSGTSRRRSRRRPRAIGIDSERASSSHNLICEDHRVGGCEIDDGLGSIRLARAPAYLRRASAAERPGARRNAEIILYSCILVKTTLFPQSTEQSL